MAILDIFSDYRITIWALVSCFSVMLFNVNGLILTQRVSATFRAIWDAMRTIIITIACVSLGLDNPTWTSLLIQCGGFCFMILGNFVYNEILEVKFCGMNAELAKYREATDLMKNKKKINSNGEKKHILSETD